jgi:hypothetical protein
MTPADFQSVFVAVNSGIFKFTPPNIASQIRNAFGFPVTDLATDSLGRLYVATWGSGVYRIDGGTTQSLGYLSVPSNIYFQNKGANGKNASLKILVGRPNFIPLNTLLGRKIGQKLASGIYVNPKP